jgi:hypothetical protein
MASPALSSNPYLPFDIQNSRIPMGGPKAIPIPISFATVAAWLLDLSNSQQLGHIEYVQTLFVDNSANAAALTIQTDASNQTVIIPPKSQGFVPVLQPNPPKLIVSTTAVASLVVTIHALNFPVSPAVWPITSPPAFTFSGSALLVQDSALEALINTYNGFTAFAVADQYMEARYAGRTMYSVISTNTAMAVNVKASAGRVKHISAFNNSANIAYLKLYNSASAPTAGSGTPVRRMLIPANASGAGFEAEFGADGLLFSSGIGFTLVGLIADNDATAVAANAFLINIDYE